MLKLKIREQVCDKGAFKYSGVKNYFGNNWVLFSKGICTSPKQLHVHHRLQGCVQRTVHSFCLFDPWYVDVANKYQPEGREQECLELDRE